MNVTKATSPQARTSLKIFFIEISFVSYCNTIYVALQHKIFIICSKYQQ